MSGSMITDHVYVSRSGEPWDLCVCGISRPAHEREDAPMPMADTYRCPYCVWIGLDFCQHGPHLALSMKGEPL
jgi:hypothetical protein